MGDLLRRHCVGARLTLTLCRPEVHNALNDTLIDALRVAFEEASEDAALRCVVVEGEGRSFCAGADLTWMKALVDASPEENRADARRLVRLLDAMVACKRPVIARVHGAALGGGMGLVAACDLVVAHPKARFGLTEVRLGLAPAMIFPYLLRKVQRQHLLAAALTGERFDAEQAWRLGVVNEVSEDLDAVIARWEAALVASGPAAVSAV
ncbi:MAG: enoyl-CoA hydratase/isomerase family protein, partial [Deltaproteobacteria bacterium]|nr:enoyl-CoA hydratase/isomerase family protein [Deltaproteobacteria bacterium]